MILTQAEARRLAHDTMTAVGHTSDEADIISDHLIDCELRGLSFGGLPRALSIVERIRATQEPRRPITVVRETPVSATLDGGDQVGYLVAHRATEIAVEKARTTGLAVVGGFETWYTGMFSYYLERVTAAGFAGMIAGSAPQKVAPAGGTEARFGTNPIAFGFPSKEGPIIWDIGTASIMAGQVVMALRMGEKLPEGSAYTADGRPTRDPSEAARGAWSVWGGHKGSGLAVVVQLLGMMAGASADPQGIRDCGYFMLVVDPEVLTSAEDYQHRVAEYAASLRTTRPIDPGQPVRAPFDRSRSEREKRVASDKIDVPDKIVEALRAVISAAKSHKRFPVDSQD